MEGIKLIDGMNGRKNNLDFIRFMAALAVIFSHAFSLSEGNSTNEWIVRLTNGQTNLGHIAVFIFFITSGFLITQSFERTKKPYNYLKARILRIFPALIVVIVCSAFILGPLVTTLPLVEYFTNINTYTYLTSILLHPINPFLPGVFETNIYKSAINGSLWTLQYEFLFYLVVLVLGVKRLLKSRVIIFCFGLFLILTFFNLPFGDTIAHIPKLFSYFLVGMIFYLLRDKIIFNKVLLIISILTLILTAYIGGFIYGLMFAGSYILFYFAYSKKIKFHGFSKYGDFSYGMYIFAFPVQQTVTQFFGGEMNVYVNFMISAPITLLLSILSWHFVEKKALQYKKAKPTIKQEINTISC